VRRLVILLAACSAAPAPRPATTPAVVENRPAHTCADAAVGLESATKGVRSPESSVFEPMRDRCIADAWPVDAVNCFATMREGELGACARQLHDDARDAFFGVLAGGTAERGSLEVARARLDALDVPIAECHEFVRSVRTVLACEQMPLESRIELGNETADFWNLPAHLPDDAQRRMADACGSSLTQLRDRVTGLGCML
jgi:hypothetical protein